MALCIKNAETERLARQLARATGESLTQAIQRAVEDRLRQLPRRRQRPLHTRLEEILRRVDALPILDTRPEAEILGYDRDGIPR